MATKADRYEGIDGLKAYAIIGIALMHVLSNGKYEIGGFAFNQLIPSFTNLVFLFMMVSGFGMCCGYYQRIIDQKISVEDFYKKRYIKIWPYFALLCALDFVISPSKELVFGICAVAKEFVPLFFGTGFDLVVPLLYTLAPYIIFVSWANVLKTQVLLPNNKDMTFVVCLILGAFVNVVLNYCLIGTSGAVGAAIATTISEGLIAVSETVALRKLIDVKRYLIQGLPFILFGFLMFSVIHDLYVLNDIITLICKVMIGAIVYLVCSWLYIYRFYPDVITSLKVFRRKKE